MEPDESRTRLLAVAAALLARGEEKFSIASVCAEAGVSRADFHEHFAGKAALMAALAERSPAPETRSEPPATDVWLERRLRVFERALTTLEAQAEANMRAHATAIARLEERLAALAAPVVEAAPATVEAVPEPAPQSPPQPVAEHKPMLDALPLEPQPAAAVSREDMSAALQSARNKMVAAEPPRRRKWRIAYPRWTVVGALSLVALLFGIALTMGGAAQASGQGVARRQAASGLARLQAQADSGDAHAQAQLAMTYLRAGDVARALRWSEAAAESGQPVAQYLLGTLTGDKAHAVMLFRAAAVQGNLKAMHNLAIAYAQGQGVAADAGQAADWFAHAAAHGYVDSAFDLAVLYERGLGVRQDLGQALKWYAIAAREGDLPSRARAEFLRGQVTMAEVQTADAAARSFAPLPAAEFANRL